MVRYFYEVGGQEGSLTPEQLAEVGWNRELFFRGVLGVCLYDHRRNFFRWESLQWLGFCATTVAWVKCSLLLSRLRVASTRFVCLSPFSCWASWPLGSPWSNCVEFWELFGGAIFGTNLTSVATDNLQNKENVCILSYALQEPLRSSWYRNGKVIECRYCGRKIVIKS